MCRVRCEKGEGGRRGRAKVKVSFSSFTLEGLDVLGELFKLTYSGIDSG